MVRHKEKDDAAGGEGLGVVETRKRMWRDANGNITTKRPKIPEYPAQEKRLSNGYMEPDDFGNRYEIQEVVEPLSPPRSLFSSGSGGRTQQDLSVASFSNELWTTENLPDFLDTSPGTCDFLENSSWGSQPSQTTLPIGGNSFDDMFSPDTGMINLSSPLCVD